MTGAVAETTLLRSGSTVARVPEILWRRTLGGAAVLLRSGEIVSLDTVGAAVWDLISQPVDIELLTREVSEVFGVSVDIAGQAVLDLLGELAGHAVVEVTG